MRTKDIISLLCLLCVPLLADPAHAADYVIHVGGVCSVDFTGVGKGDDDPEPLGVFAGVDSVDAQVDQRDTMSKATADMKAVLDAYCLGDDWCYIYTFSNGGATISRTLSVYDTRWNIYYVLNSASNEGGSELSYTGWLASAALGCDLAGDVGPSDHRNGWNHNDTDGVGFSMIGAYGGPWYTAMLLPGQDDGTVPFHSSGAMNDTYAADNLCQDDRQWANHEIAWTCEGYDLDHAGMKMKGLCELGGC